MLMSSGGWEQVGCRWEVIRGNIMQCCLQATNQNSWLQLSSIRVPPTKRARFSPPPQSPTQNGRWGLSSGSKQVWLDIFSILTSLIPDLCRVLLRHLRTCQTARLYRIQCGGRFPLPEVFWPKDTDEWAQTLHQTHSLWLCICCFSLHSSCQGDRGKTCFSLRGHIVEDASKAVTKTLPRDRLTHPSLLTQSLCTSPDFNFQTPVSQKRVKKEMRSQIRRMKLLQRIY